MACRKNVTCIVIAVLCFSGSPQARKLRIGIYDFPPLCSIQQSSNGDMEASGLFVDVLEHIAKAENWSLEYVPGTYVEGVDKIENDEIDLLLAVPYSQKNDLAVSNETVVSTWAEIHTASGREIRSLTDLDSMIIGVRCDDPHNVSIRTLVEGLDVSCRFAEFKSYGDIVSAMNNKWVDAGVFDRLFADNKMDARQRNCKCVFSPVEFRIGVNGRNDPALDKIIDFRLTQLKNNNSSIYHQLFKELMGGSNSMKGIPNWVKWASGAGGILLVSFLLLNLVLRTQVRLKTKELLDKNRELKNEIALRISAEREKNKSLDQLQITISSLRDAIVVSCRDTIIHCNSTATDIFGVTVGNISYQSIIGFLFHNDNPKCSIENIFNKIMQTGYYFSEINLIRQDQTEFTAELAIKPIGEIKGIDTTTIVIVRDISEREKLKQSEAMLRQAQKMEAIGTLSGGIAHDFNNILVPICGYAQMLGKSLEEVDGTLKKYANRITLAAERARELVQQIMAFSRQRDKESQFLSLSTITKEVLKLLRASVPATISITSECNGDNDTIYCDPTHIHQVIMNLCTNAVYAMKKDGGSLTVTVRNFNGSIESAGINEKVEMGNWVVLSIEDTGTGIDPLILSRIYDPFYTTKPQSEGTGMGLSVVHGIIKDYNGTVHVKSTIGHGTRFDVYLPLAKQKKYLQNTLEKETDSFSGNGFRILLVDDETFIVEMVTTLLEETGYNVTGFTNAAKALEVFMADPHRFDLVITDQTMPRLTGKELSGKIFSCRKDIPIILCTGFSEAFTKEQAKKNGIRKYLLKPFGNKEILAAIHNILAGSSTRAAG